MRDSAAPADGSARLPVDLPYSAPPAASAALPARTWKLSHAQYARAVEDLVGIAVDMSDFEVEIDNSVYPNMSGSGLVRATLARNYYESAQRVSGALRAEQLASLIGARPLDASSRSVFLDVALRRAFRRAPSPDERATYGEIFELGASEDDDGLGSFRAVLRALLTSPLFLYRTEIGLDPASETFELTGYEVASLLSFSLLGRPPDEGLLRAAERGELSEPTALAGHVNTLLETGDATTTLSRFMSEWLKIHHFDQVDKDPGLFPGFAAIRPAMLAEATDFLANHGALAGTLPGLLTSPAEPEGALADYYASDPTADGEQGARWGVLGLGAVMAARSKANVTSPTLRGLFVRDRVLCQEVHLPPDLPTNIVDTLLRSAPRTTRELYELHAQDPSCAGCHSLLDSIGFNFEDFDASGRYRTRENGVAIDTRGELRAADLTRTTANHRELVDQLAASEWVRECVARQAFRFYFGQVEAHRGLPAVQAARGAIASGTFRELVSALMTTPSTYQRVRH